MSSADKVDLASAGGGPTRLRRALMPKQAFYRRVYLCTNWNTHPCSLKWHNHSGLSMKSCGCWPVLVCHTLGRYSANCVSCRNSTYWIETSSVLDVSGLSKLRVGTDRRY